jgi:hypothetical protein
MLLGKFLKEVGSIEARSQNISEIMTDAAQAITRFGSTLNAEAQGFLTPLRMTGIIPSALDRWFGQLADFVELLQAAGHGSSARNDLQALSPWIQELLDARSNQDPVRLADILEFEVLPHLATR